SQAKPQPARRSDAYLPQGELGAVRGERREIPAAVAVVAFHLDRVPEREAGEIRPGRHRTVDEGRVAFDLDAEAVRTRRRQYAVQVEPACQAVVAVPERRVVG